MQSCSLTDKHCVPCQGGTPPMSEPEAKRMLTELEGWELKDGATKLHRRYTFKNFKRALKYVNKLGEVAETEKHHPDIHFGWGYVALDIQTHKINGLTESDFVLAAKAEKIHADMAAAV